MPAWRDHTATMTSADNMILFGGFDGNDLISATTEIDLAVAAANDANAAFSPTTKAIASPVSARSGHSTILWGKKVVMFGGEKGTTALAYGVGERLYQDTHVLDLAQAPPVWASYECSIPSSGAVSTCTNGMTGHPPFRRRYHTAVLYQGSKMVIHGGFLAKKTHTSNTAVLDLTTMVWSCSLAPFTYACSTKAADMFTITSYSNTCEDCEASNGNYDSSTVTQSGLCWTDPAFQLGTDCAGVCGQCGVLPNAPPRREKHSAVMHPDGVSMIIFGGTNGVAKFNDVAVLNLATNTWSYFGVGPQETDTNTRTPRTSALANPPEGRMLHSATMYGNLMLIFGGTGARNLRDLAVLDCTTIAAPVWQPSWVTKRTPSARYGMAAGMWGPTRLVIWGGSDGGVLNDVHTLDLLTREWSEPKVKGTKIKARTTSTAGIVVDNSLFVWGGTQVVGSTTDADHLASGGKLLLGSSNVFVVDAVNGDDLACQFNVATPCKTFDVTARTYINAVGEGAVIDGWSSPVVQLRTSSNVPKGGLTLNFKQLTLEGKCGAGNSAVAQSNAADGGDESCALLCDGTCFTVQEETSLFIKDLTLRGATTSALIAEGRASITLTNSLITNSTAVDGGAAYFSGNTTLTMSNCDVAENTASTGDGGAIYLTGSKLKLTSSKIQRNTANKGSGGGVFADKSSTVTIKGGALEKNAAKEDGGAIFAASGSSVAVTGGTSIAKNTAHLGAAMYSVFTEVSVSGGVTITGNAAKLAAGGHFCVGTTPVAYNNITFVNNSAGKSDASSGDLPRGGAIFLSQCSPNVQGVTFSGNSAGMGGAAFVGSGSSLSIFKSTLTSNVARATDGGMGGGIACDECDELHIKGCRFESNRAKTHGGAVSVEMPVEKLQVENTTFEWNTAETGNGGALHTVLHDPVSLTLNKGVVFRGNSAPRGGGGAAFWSAVDVARIPPTRLIVDGAELQPASGSLTAPGRNKAMYGDGVATNGTFLDLDPPMLMVPQRRGAPFSTGDTTRPLAVRLLDFYGQIVASDSLTSVSFEAESSSAHSYGPLSVQLTKGVGSLSLAGLSALATLPLPNMSSLEARQWMKNDSTAAASIRSGHTRRLSTPTPAPTIVLPTTATAYIGKNRDTFHGHAIRPHQNLTLRTVVSDAFRPELTVTLTHIAVDECLLGEYVDAANRVCGKCPPGSFAAARGMESCVPCPKGTSASAAGMAECQPCALGTFQSYPGQVKCEPTPDGSYSYVGAFEHHECPAEGVTCLGGVIYIMDGFFYAGGAFEGGSAEITSETLFIECMDEDVCVPGDVTGSTPAAALQAATSPKPPKSSVDYKFNYATGSRPAVAASALGRRRRLAAIANATFDPNATLPTSWVTCGGDPLPRHGPLCSLCEFGQAYVPTGCTECDPKLIAARVGLNTVAIIVGGMIWFAVMLCVITRPRADVERKAIIARKYATKWLGKHRKWKAEQMMLEEREACYERRLAKITDPEKRALEEASHASAKKLDEIKEWYVPLDAAKAQFSEAAWGTMALDKRREAIDDACANPLKYCDALAEVNRQRRMKQLADSYNEGGADGEGGAAVALGALVVMAAEEEEEGGTLESAGEANETVAIFTDLWAQVQEVAEGQAEAFSGIFKVILGNLQICGGFLSVFVLPFPSGYKSFLRSLEIFKFDLVGLVASLNLGNVKGSCIAASFYEGLLVFYALPLAVIIFGLLATLVATFVRSCKLASLRKIPLYVLIREMEKFDMAGDDVEAKGALAKKVKLDSDTSRAEFKEAMAANIAKRIKMEPRYTTDSMVNLSRKLISTVVLFLYPGICNKTFLALKCQTVGSNEYLLADLAVQCNVVYDIDGNVTVWFIMTCIAIIGLVIYVIGVPLFYLFTLYGLRAKLHPSSHVEELDSAEQVSSHQQLDYLQHVRAKDNFGGLYKAYKPHAWWFEIVQTARKMIFTGALIMVAQGSVLQVLIAVIVCIFYILFLANVDPFVEPREGIIAQVESVQVLLVLILGIALKLREATLAATGGTGDPGEAVLWTVMLIVLNLATVVIGFFLTLQGLPCFADWDTTRESIYIFGCPLPRWCVARNVFTTSMIPRVNLRTNLLIILLTYLPMSDYRFSKCCCKTSCCTDFEKYDEFTISTWNTIGGHATRHASNIARGRRKIARKIHAATDTQARRKRAQRLKSAASVSPADHASEVEMAVVQIAPEETTT